MSKHALIIGVDEYPNFDESKQLSGCVNDAQLLGKVLVDYFDFEPENIQQLHNSAATREGIIAAMENLLDSINTDDVVVFHFSGHGSRRRAATLSKGTGKDSTIMPCDTGRQPLPNLDIANTEINDWIARVTDKTSNLSLTFDCCHSGTVTRDAFAAKIRGIPDDDRSIEEMGISPAAATRSVDGTDWMTLSDRYVVISGCRDNEYSHELTQEDGGKTIHNGALTHFLVSALLKAQPGSSYRDVFEEAHRNVNTQYPSQNPQIEGAKDRELFGTREITPIRFVPVENVDGDSVVLGGGAAHGLVSGSIWSVLPPGSKSKDDVIPLGTLQIDSVDSLSSEASINTATQKILVGSRCIEAEPAPQQFQLKIDLSQVQDCEDLVEGIAKSDLLTAADNANSAEIRAYRLPPRSAACEPVPTLSEIRETSWVFVNEQGDVAMPVHAVNKEQVINTLVTNLESISRYRNALRLDNPDDYLDIEFNVYRLDENREWHTINGGDWVFDEGDYIAFDLINHESSAVYLSVLDFGLSGKISLLWPPRTSSELIGAGQTVRIGTGKNRIKLGLPKGFSAPQGVGALKAFVTSGEADFQWLQQESLRSAGTGSESQRLRRQFEAAYNGPKYREAVFDAEEESDTWTAVTRSFAIRRK